MVANYNSATAILRLHPQKLYHLLLLLLLTPCATPLTFRFPTFQQSNRIFTEGDAVIGNQYIHLNKENLRAESSTGSVGRATFYEPFLLRENSTGKLADFTTSFAFIIDERNMSFYGEGLAFFLAPWGSLLKRTLGKGSSLGLPVNSSVENVIEPSNDYPFVAVEFDTYRNSGPTVKDPDGNHVGIDINCLKSNITRAWNGGIVEAKLNRAWISYNSSSKNLSVAFTTFNDDTQEQKISYLSYMVDLNKYLPDWVIVGFSASSSTGAGSALHNIISWNFTSTELVDNEVLALSGREEIIFETPVPYPSPSSKVKARKRKKPLAVVIGSSIGGFILVCFLGLGLYNSCKKKATRTTDGNLKYLSQFFEGKSLKRFPYKELVLATRNFFEGEKLGEGGSGVVYKGYITYLNSYVAVKKISRGPKHGIDEYAPQLQKISRCMHRNLVQLIGWCHEKGELLLVYEFMPNGSLDSHLLKAESLLSWELRYKIVQGLASGLLYLHEQPLLHGNIKSSNVVVDSDFNAKLGDFGFRNGKEPQMITTGYMAPEYIDTRQLSKKSDVFSFGIVALEISCGRKLIDPKFGGSQVNMVE
ncbi:L-type lectin-domain containing receptor kinase IX.2-like [Prunus avium]|uniref:non-specific serine/threonine protein kinase n=1 Tax=Prunus avium TaxID=42229 RepID=A0A6P5REH1_PRUAV|nr:L-type lectin-domain containing receptor kinase IX.2-like [Prunus avium]